MNYQKWVKASNLLGIISSILLIYWVFSFILIQVFGLRVFQRNLTEMFMLSVMGIIALMAAALMLNIMLNLTRIAEREPIHHEIKKSKKIIYLFLLIFPLLAGLLFGGHHLTVQKKQQILVQSAMSLVSHSPKQAQELANYQFNINYLNKVSDILSIWNKKDRTFSYASVIVQDEIDGEKVWLEFDGNRNYSSKSISTDNININKIDYLFNSDLATRNYLQATFDSHGDGENIYFSEENGQYELYYPYVLNGKVVAVFRFSDYQRYGKIGS